MRQFEDWFREDFSRIRLFLLPRHPAAQALSRPLAFATSDAIFLSDLVLNSRSAVQCEILAHELAHVVQKRRAHSRLNQSRQAATAVLEREADEAALAFSSNELCPPLSADFANAARQWGPAGHYYTVYFIARETGLADAVAEQLAFCAQMPDQVSDLDAVVAGEGFTAMALMTPAMKKASLRGDEMDLYNLQYHMQAGLHCLNGNPGVAETKRRLANLRQISKLDATGIFVFGLGLHALGDSYAHRRSDGPDALLFQGPYGHFLQGNNPYEAMVKLGTEVDNLHKRSALYQQYCADMLAVIAECFKPKGDSRTYVPPPGDAGLAQESAKQIAFVASKPDEAAQINALRSYFISSQKNPYQPEEKPMPWEAFMRAHPRQTARWMPQKAREMADRWW